MPGRGGAAILIVIALLAVGAVALSRLDPAPPPAEFTFANRNENFTLDPQRMSWMHDLRVGYALYEQLVRWNPDDFTIIPGVAIDWRLADDQRTWTFTLASDARWSDGQPVTAHDFVWSIQRMLMPDTAADYSELLFAIEGGEAFFIHRNEQSAAWAALPPEARTFDAALAQLEAAEARFVETVGVRAVDDHTLEIRLAQPVPYFLDLLAFAVLSPVNRPTVEGWTLTDEDRAAMVRDGWATIVPPPFAERRWVSLDLATGRLRQNHAWTKPAHFVGNGPYTPTMWRYRRGLRLEASPTYHRADEVRCRTIECVAIPNPSTAVLAFETGQVDWLTDIGADYESDMLAEARAYLERYGPEIGEAVAGGASWDDALAAAPPPGPGERRDLHALPTFGTDFYSFNCRPTLLDGGFNPFADARVRRAFVQAVDRELLTRAVTRLHEPVATTITPEGAIPGYDPPAGLGCDPDAARAELAAAGWIDRDGDGLVENDAGERFPIVDLLYSTNGSRYKQLSLALRDMWRDELGVQVELRGMDATFFRQDLKNGQFMIARGRWYGDYGDPSTFLDIFRTGHGNNDRGYSNPRVDAMLAAADAETDPARRFAIMRDCETFLFREEAPMLILCQLIQLYMYDPAQVTGLCRQPRLVHYLHRVETARSRAREIAAERGDA